MTTNEAENTNDSNIKWISEKAQRPHTVLRLSENLFNQTTQQPQTQHVFYRIEWPWWMTWIGGFIVATFLWAIVIFAFWLGGMMVIP